MKRKASVVAVLLVLAVFAAGCPKTVYDKAVVAEHDFSLGLQSFQQAEMQEFQSGRIDAATHKQLEGGVERVAIATQVLVTSLQGGANNTTVQQNFATVSTAVTDLLNSGVLGIKNQQSQELLKTLIKTVQAILQNVGTLLSAPTTTTVTTKGGF